MIEIGKLIEAKNDNKARILIARNAACCECGACQVGRDKLKLQITAEKNIVAPKDDNVILKLDTGKFLLVSIIFYGVTLLALILA